MAELIAQLIFEVVGDVLERLFSLRPVLFGSAGALAGAVASLIIAHDVAYGALWTVGGAAGFLLGSVMSLRRVPAAAPPNHIDSR